MGDLRERFYSGTANDFNRDFSEPGRVVEVRPGIVATVAGNNSRTDPTKAKGFWLIPTRPLAQLAEVYRIGAEKYEPRGWENGMPFSEIVDGLYRHMSKYLSGETHDAEDGQHHLASVAWRAFALMEYERTHPEMDDLQRPKADKGWPQFTGLDHDD